MKTSNHFLSFLLSLIFEIIIKFDFFEKAVSSLQFYTALFLFFVYLFSIAAKSLDTGNYRLISETMNISLFTECKMNINKYVFCSVYTPSTDWHFHDKIVRKGKDMQPAPVSRPVPPTLSSPADWCPLIVMFLNEYRKTIFKLFRPWKLTRERYL